MGKYSDFLLNLLAQFGGGRGGIENNLVRFGLAAILWGVLLVVAWWKRREQRSSYNRLLMAGFGLGLFRESFMFAVISLEMLNIVKFGSSHPFFPPLEHALSMAAVVLVAGAFMQYLLERDSLARGYLQIGLGATAFCYLATFWWWARFIRANPSFRFGQTWCDWLFRLTAVVLIAVPIYFLSKKRGWVRSVVCLALFFFFLDDFLMLFNLASGDVYKEIYAPVRQCLHILAIPLLGHVYFIEQSARRKVAEDALRRSHKDLKTIIDSIPDTFLVIDRQHRIVVANSVARENAGGIDPVASGMRCYQLSHHRDAPCEGDKDPCPLRQVLDTKQPVRMMHTHIQSEGVPRWVEVVASPIFDDAGEVVRIIEVCRDVTESKEAHRRQELTAQVLSLLNQLVERTDVLHDILISIKEFTGFEAAALRLKEGDDFPFFETDGFPADFVETERYLSVRDETGEIVWNLDGNPSLKCICGDVLSGRADPSLPFFSKGGSFWVNSTTKFLASTPESNRPADALLQCNSEGYESVALIPIRSDQEIIGMLQLNDHRKNMLNIERINFLEGLGASIGIALARRQTEHQLQMLLRLQETTIDNTPIFLIVLDADLNILTANRSYLAAQGLQLSEVIGKYVGDVLGKSFLVGESLLSRLAAVAKNGGRDELWGVPHGTDGRSRKYFNVKICGIQLMGSGEGEPRVLLMLEDITERRNLEEQVRQAAKIESIGKLAGGVAHDFNNLLTGIKGYVSFVLDDLDPDSAAHREIAEVNALADRAANLTRQLLAFSRRQTLEMVVLNINESVENVMKMLRRLIGEDIKLEFRPEKNLGSVRADPGQVEQILMNLAVNARDAMPNGGKLIIETANVILDRDYAEQHVDVQPGPHVLLAMTDTGCGMERETLEHIFEPFFTTKEMGKGTGLGLATVHGIVKQHGGSIWVYSEPGKGTTFKIYLPRVDANAQALTTKEDRNVTISGTETILLVEDEKSIRDVAWRALESHGYTVLAAGSAEEAEKLFAKHGNAVQLLLTDVVLPGRNGRELYERLATKQSLLRVLYMSGYTDDAVFHTGRLSEGTVLLKKPFAPADLLRKVRETLDG